MGGGRSAKVAKLGAKVGGTFASTAARKVFASAERRIELDERREMKTAAAVAEELGHMKGALMKLGQMASYLDEGLPEPLRMALAQLRSSAPPMSSELAASVVERELGAPHDEISSDGTRPDRSGLDRPGAPLATATEARPEDG